MDDGLHVDFNLHVLILFFLSFVFLEDGLVENRPLAFVVFERAQVFNPVAGVEIGRLAFVGQDFAYLWLVDVPASHKMTAFLNGKLGGGLFKITNVSHRFFDAALDFFGERIFFAPEHFQDRIHIPVKDDQKVVAPTAEFGDPLAVLDGSVKNVAVKNPGFLPVQVEHQFIGQHKITHFKIGKLAQHLVVVAGDVIDFGAFGSEVDEFFQHFQVMGRKVFFAELPNVDDVAVEDEQFGFDRFQVMQQLPGMAAIGAEVDVGKNDQFYFSLFQVQTFLQIKNIAPKRKSI